MSIVVGIDFDNTIVSYDDLFWRLARGRNLIPEEVRKSKDEVRDYLRAVDREDEWTELQGVVYGSRMPEARVFPGVGEFLAACRAADICTTIISHKTRLPFVGPAIDLQASARTWLKAEGFFDPPEPLVEPGRVHFELTKREKLERIAAEGCTHFIDDLPEFLIEPEFPRGVLRILFDPLGRHRSDDRFVRLTSWSEISEHILSITGSGP